MYSFALYLLQLEDELHLIAVHQRCLQDPETCLTHIVSSTIILWMDAQVSMITKPSLTDSSIL